MYVVALLSKKNVQSDFIEENLVEIYKANKIRR